MSILPIVVLYNSDFHETAVYQTLLRYYPSLRILLYENSQEPLNKGYESPTALYYHDMANGGVSAAYNYGAMLARQQGNVGALLLLDEDTTFNSDYISKIEEKLDLYQDICLFVPQIFFLNNTPFSPNCRQFRLHRGVCLDEGIYSLKRYLPVNSGACVRLKAFEKSGGYNNKIRLDFADFDFFSRLAVVSERFYLVNSIAKQSFSNEEIQKDRLFQRFKLYLEGAKTAKSNEHIRNWVLFDMIRHTLALSVRTKSLDFVSYLFKNFR